MEFFLQHKQLIIRSVGAFLLLVGFALYFWSAPKLGVDENAKAAANVARMEAKVSGVATSAQKAKPASAQIAEKFQETRQKQIRYLLIIMMVAGGGFLLYSFLKKEE